MSNQDNPTSFREKAQAEGKRGGLAQILTTACFVAVASYFVNQLSLAGVNFELGEVVPGITINSEAVKSQIVAASAVASITLTPRYFAASVRDAIVFVRQTLDSWGEAWTSGK